MKELRAVTNKKKRGATEVAPRSPMVRRLELTSVERSSVIREHVLGDLRADLLAHLVVEAEVNSAIDAAVAFVERELPEAGVRGGNVGVLHVVDDVATPHDRE